MGFAGMYDREIVNTGRYEGLNTGWSYFKPLVPKPTRSETTAAQRMGFSPSPSVHEIRSTQIQNIHFATIKDKSNYEEEYALLSKWKSITEYQYNGLLNLKTHLVYYGSQISLMTVLDDIEKALNNLLELLSKYSICKPVRNSIVADNDYLIYTAKTLIDALLGNLKEIDDNNHVERIISDLKYLIAVEHNCKNSEGDYKCSDVLYMEYLKEHGLLDVVKECPNCFVRMRFLGYRYCLCCGERLKG